MPVYQGIITMQPNRLILIHSIQSKKQAEIIAREFSCEKDFAEIDPVQLSSIEQSLLAIKKNISEDDEVSINVSGGTKPWAILIVKLFANHPKCRFFYIDQNNQLWDFYDNSQQLVEFDMNVQFKLQGNPLLNYSSLDDFSEEDLLVIPEIKELRSFNHGDFLYMTQFLLNNTHQKTAVGKQGSTIDWNTEKQHFQVSMKKSNGSTISKTLRSKNIRYLLLNTGWFEVEVGQLLRNWASEGSIYMNCIFPTLQNQTKNEIDIIINTGNKLFFIECKTQINKITDIDKFASAVRVYGGLGSKAIFITDAPLNMLAKEKCSDHNMLAICLQELAKKGDVETELHKMLDSQLQIINTK